MRYKKHYKRYNHHRFKYNNQRYNQYSRYNEGTKQSQKIYSEKEKQNSSKYIQYQILISKNPIILVLSFFVLAFIPLGINYSIKLSSLFWRYPLFNFTYLLISFLWIMWVFTLIGYKKGCHKCGRFFAYKTIHSQELNREHNIETKYKTHTHYDEKGRVIGSSRVPFNEHSTHVTTFYLKQCKYCGYQHEETKKHKE